MTDLQQDLKRLCQHWYQLGIERGKNESRRSRYDDLLLAGAAGVLIGIFVGVFL